MTPAGKGIHSHTITLTDYHVCMIIEASFLRILGEHYAQFFPLFGTMLLSISACLLFQLLLDMK